MNQLERFFLGKYLQAPKRYLGRFSFVFMILGIILSVGILSAGLNLFSGYERSLREVLLGSFPHIVVQDAFSGSFSPEGAHRIISLIAKEPGIVSVIPTISSSVMTRSESKTQGAALAAYDFEPGMSLPFAKYVTQGTSTLIPGQVIVGKYLARELGKSLADSITVVYPQLNRISALGMFPSELKLKIVGIYDSGLYEQDRSMLITTAEDAISILASGPGYNKLEIRLQPEKLEQAEELSTKLQQSLGPELMIYPWTQYSKGLLQLVAMEKWLIFIIFSFLVLIAGINVISATTTVILDKKNEIAVLKTIGASEKSIRHLLGYRIGLVAIASILAGQLFGMGLSIFVEKQSFYRLKGDVYFIDTLSADISLLNLAIVFAVAMILIWACIRYPLRQISKMQIIEILRNP